MDTPADFFFFSVTTEDGVRYTFVYSPDVDLFSSQLNAIALKAFEGPITPEALILMGPDTDGERTLNQLRSNDPDGELESVRDRLSDHTPLIYVSLPIPFSGTVSAEPVFAGSQIDDNLRRLIESQSWIDNGLQEVFSEELVVHRAPPGYAFLKPSGDSSQTFLKPEFALSSSPNVSFVAFAILRKMFKGKHEYATQVRVLYVDTMAIAPVAFEVRELLRRSGASQSIRISSFHSYDGMENISNPMENSSLCIISASSSMSLHDRWLKDKGAAPGEVVTLVTQSSARQPERALFSLAPEPSNFSEGPPDLCIKIYGESFTPALETPKKVLLRHEAHKIDVGVIHKLRNSQVFDLLTPDRASSGSPRSLHANGEKLVESQDFSKWIDLILPQLLKANCKNIIHQNDKASANLANKLALRCKNISGLEPTCISATEVGEQSVSKDAAVIVCAAVAGKGSELLQISRSLRDIHDGPRLYVIGLQITETRNEIAKLRENLVFREPFRYDYSLFGSVATGSQLIKSFGDEAKLYQIPGVKEITPAGLLSERAERLCTTEYTGNSAFLPFGHDADRTMTLRRGFAFWQPKNYDPGNYHAEVVATICGILQRAREEKKIQDSDRLSSPTFRHILLDPENFSRYNDGLIQSAILRCAYPSEMDYRSDQASSDFIKQLIVRLIQRVDSDHGEAALEFLLALCLGNLKLHQQHVDVIRRTIESAPASNPVKRFMQFLIDGPSSIEVAENDF